MPLGTASLISTIILPFEIAGQDRRVREGRTNTGLVEKAQQVLADCVSDQGLLSDRALDLPVSSPCRCPATRRASRPMTPMHGA